MYERSVVSPHLQQVYIAGATRARRTEGPCLRHASHAEQGSKLEALGGGVVGLAYITNRGDLNYRLCWPFFCSLVWKGS